MEWMIPGTVVSAQREDAQLIEQRFQAMFLAGGIVLSQVSNLTGLEPYTIQNWVKRGFLAGPENKRYTLRQLCRILNINMLKSALSMEQICGLLSYVNGELDNERDDLIDDSKLYFLFVRLASDYSRMHNSQGRDLYLQELLADYQEPVPGAKERVAQVLRIMLTAWAAAQLRQSAENMVKSLQETANK